MILRGKDWPDYKISLRLTIVEGTTLFDGCGMINIENALKIHSILIDKFGGSKGIRDNKLLESALLRPYQTFNKKELYPAPINKAAAIIESIITN